MAYNLRNKDYSNDFYEALYELGLYAQPDGSLAISNKLPRNHIDYQYLVSFFSLEECIKYLESELEEEVKNYTNIWKSLDEETTNKEFEMPNYNPTIRDDLIFSFLNSLIDIANKHENLDDIIKKLHEIKNNIFYISNELREKLGRYSLIIQLMDAEILGENQRILILKHLKDSYQNEEIKSMLKYAYYVPYGMEEGIGPRGRNNPLTPFGGYDYYYDRVMDGTELHDYSGGHATEKFIGRDGYNKFKKYPHLLRKTKLKLRTKPLRYLSRKKRRKLKSKKNKNWKNSVHPTGLVYNELDIDPQHYYWWDLQRNNPYSWSTRDETGTYPTWDSYR